MLFQHMHFFLLSLNCWFFSCLFGTKVFMTFRERNKEFAIVILARKIGLSRTHTPKIPHVGKYSSILSCKNRAAFINLVVVNFYMRKTPHIPLTSHSTPLDKFNKLNWFLTHKSVWKLKLLKLNAFWPINNLFQFTKKNCDLFTMTTSWHEWQRRRNINQPC